MITLQLQLASEGIIYPIGTFHMTCGTDTHLNDMLAIGSHTQLRIEGGYADDLCTIDIGPFIQTTERIDRQVIEFLLYGLQQRNNQFAPRTYPVDYGIRFTFHHLG